MEAARFLLFFFALLSFVPLTTAIYGRVPGERYVGFLRKLNDADRLKVRAIIFNPNYSKARARREVERWAHAKSPLTLEAFDFSMMEYEDVQQENTRILDERAKKYSRSGRRVDAQIRAIYANEKLTERAACDEASDVIARTRPAVLQEVGLEPLNCDQIFELVLTTLLLLALFYPLASAYPMDRSEFDYHRQPGERYLPFVKRLTAEQKQIARKIIFNPQKSRRAAYADLQHWANDVSPLTMMLLDRTVLDYEEQEIERERRFERRALRLSPAARELDVRLRALYANDLLSELSCCEQTNRAIAASSPQIRDELDVEVIDCSKHL
ncbi:hypothetical protein M3Y99_01752800 [Aphelenchoides fujianensis]|nr:hypothetical protein M3Y99_01752800 [Aphelenchoides fujianensis]